MLFSVRIFIGIQMSFSRIALIASLGTLTIVAVIVLNMTQFSQRFEEKQAMTAASLDDLRRKNDELQTKLTALAQENVSLQAKLEVQQRDLQSKFSQSREEVQSLQVRQHSFGIPVSDLERLQTELQQFKTASITHNQEQQVQLRKLSFSLGVLLRTLDRQNTNLQAKDKGVYFSAFEGHDWKKSVNDYLLHLSSFSIAAPKIIDTIQGTDTYSDRIAGDYLLNGIFFRSVETFDFFNGQPNNIDVLAPGLVALENNVLEIIADKDLDKVRLDGCLKWTKAARKENAVIWTATDTGKMTRTVKIAKDIQVQVTPTCEGDYFFMQDKKLLPAVWKNEETDEAKAPIQAVPVSQIYKSAEVSRPVEHFGGIGLSFYALDGSSLFIRGVFDGTPAEKAGLKRGDRILEIDGQTVAGMNEDTSEAMIRGPVGTVVILTYKPYGSTDASPRSASLKRELIQIDPKAAIPERIIRSKEDIENSARDAKAAKELRPRAEMGDARAQYSLAMLYTLRGLPDVQSGLVNRDEEAAKWFLKAAESGHRQAQYNIGSMYESGRGVKRDASEAYFWLMLAATPIHLPADAGTSNYHESPDEISERQTQQFAESGLTEIKKWLKLDQIMNIQKRVENWRLLKHNQQ
jgi:hypothetical protein